MKILKSITLRNFLFRIDIINAIRKKKINKEQVFYLLKSNPMPEEELLFKRLLNDKLEWVTFLRDKLKSGYIVKPDNEEEPTSYPCVVVDTGEWEDCKKSYVGCSFVYLTDFKK